LRKTLIGEELPEGLDDGVSSMMQPLTDPARPPRSRQALDESAVRSLRRTVETL
jgi:hypothetical protein